MKDRYRLKIQIDGDKYYFKNNLIHREDSSATHASESKEMCSASPAIIYYSWVLPNTVILNYFINGKKHKKQRDIINESIKNERQI